MKMRSKEIELFLRRLLKVNLVPFDYHPGFPQKEFSKFWISVDVSYRVLAPTKTFITFNEAAQ